MTAEPYLYVGRPCKRGHVGLRYWKGGNCVDCQRRRDALPERAEARKSPAGRTAARARAAKYKIKFPDYHNAYIKAYQATTRGRAKRLFQSARRRCDGVGITITREWVEEHLSAGVCELCGLPFNFKAAGPQMQGPYSPSLDRIDSSKGYTPENTRVVLWALNAAFSNWGEGTFEIIAEAWLERRRMVPSGTA